MTPTPEQKSAVREAIAQQQCDLLAASTARQALEERISTRAYELFASADRSTRQTLAHYTDVAERELTAPAPKPGKPEPKAAAAK